MPSALGRVKTKADPVLDRADQAETPDSRQFSRSTEQLRGGPATRSSTPTSATRCSHATLLHDLQIYNATFFFHMTHILCVMLSRPRNPSNPNPDPDPTHPLPIYTFLAPALQNFPILTPYLHSFPENTPQPKNNSENYQTSPYCFRFYIFYP